ncbi:zinc-binding dehydrogenase [Paenibacillus hexagrammi]|uniref:Zinc-binding dehydrogenase n=1 Tax=Paenibacillus hexagrammi TaxID=2908839 RepID=A0ABY3SFQ5_9BACL|nr:zinc-binding dehydrogenase [Paenibacillus sp. YPD9-1]UJF32011.1 zinc-binding dehydrogenase [Paenibacillus sp. YPD9-1]
MPVEEVILVPEVVPAIDAAAVILNYVTAYQLLCRCASLVAGDTVLIHGASGGVGTALLDLGRLFELRMFGTASSRKHAALECYGVRLIDYHKEDFVEHMREHVPKGVKAVFDPIGYENWGRSLQVLGPDGVLVGYGFTSILQASEAESHKYVEGWKALDGSVESGAVQRKAVTYSITGGKQQDPEAFRTDLEAVFQLLADGQIHPQIARCFSLEDIEQAHVYLHSHDSVGKIILTF